MGVRFLEDGLGVMYCFVSLIAGVGRDDVETRVPVGRIGSEWWRREDGRGRCDIRPDIYRTWLTLRVRSRYGLRLDLYFLNEQHIPEP